MDTKVQEDPISRTRRQHQTVQLKYLHQPTLMCHYLNNAQQEVIRLHQQQVFSEEIDHLRDGNTGDQKS